VLYLTALVDVDHIPTHVKNALVSQAVEDAIAAEDDEIMKLRLDCQLGYFWLSDRHSWFASVFRKL